MAVLGTREACCVIGYRSLIPDLLLVLLVKSQVWHNGKSRLWVVAIIYDTLGARLFNKIPFNVES